MYLPEDSLAIITGFPAAGNGEPATAVSAPLEALIANADIVLSEKFETYANLLEGSTANDVGSVTPPNPDPTAVNTPVVGSTLEPKMSLAPVAMLTAKANSAELVGGGGVVLLPLPQPARMAIKANKRKRLPSFRAHIKMVFMSSF